MYEESANVPMILAGPDIPRNSVCETPVSLVDIYQTVLTCVGVPPANSERDLPGSSLLDIANRPHDKERQIFCEYHASCAPTGLMMLRKGPFKYIYYTGYGAELFDLGADPDERHNLAADSDYREILENFERELRKIVDPEKVDAQAKHDQRRRLTELGGMTTIVAQGGVPHTPAPGEQPSFIGS